MLERDVEKYLVKRVKAAGGEVRKLRWIGHRGAPDRMIIFPLVAAAFVEVKRPNGTLRAEQRREHKKLIDACLLVYVVDTPASVNEMIADILHGGSWQ